jgi:hypothetical protein
MNFAAIKAQLRGLINRSDLTDAQASVFINQAQVRLERLLRLSFMQRYVTFNPPRSDGVFRVPADYLELIDLSHPTGQLERADNSRYLRLYDGTGTPEVFMQTGHDLRMRPYPLTTDTLYLQYYASELTLVADGDTNQWALCAPDALVYGAAEGAADHFEDDRIVRFASRFNDIVQELRDQQQQEDFSGPMSIQPSTPYPSDY